MRALCLVVFCAACSGHSHHGDGGTNAGDDGGGNASNDSGGMSTNDSSAASEDAGPIPTVDGGSSMAAGCTPDVTAPDTSTPRVTLTSCTEGDLQTAINGGGVIAFHCGTTTIAITKPLVVPPMQNTTIDGGGVITLDGGNMSQIMSIDGGDYRKNTHQLSLIGLTFAHGKAKGTMKYAPAKAPCSQGYYDGYGGAIFVVDAELYVKSCTFMSNNAEQIGPDVAGGGVGLNGVLKATFVDSNFVGNSASNGGAIGALNSDFNVYGGVFSANTATGNGANGDDPSKCSVKATNGQNQTGSGGNGGAFSIDGGSDLTHTFCGATFQNNKSGAAALGGAIFRTPDLTKQQTVIQSCVFDSNTSPSGGAGYFHNSTLTVTGSTFHANSAGGCGAIQADGTTFQFTNDTFDANVGTGIGGTLCLFNDPKAGPFDSTIEYSTFAANKSAAFAAAVFGSPTVAFTGCLFQNDVASSGPQDCQLTNSKSSYDLDWPKANTACVSTDASGNAQLGALGDHGGPTPTLLPAAGSPAIGAGQACPGTDQRGNARPAKGCTIGAVEGST